MTLSGALRGRRAPAGVLLLALAFFSFIAFCRVVEPEEGAIVLAGRAFFEEGLLPYRDFFSPELPVAPLAFGFIARVFGVGWLPARLFAAALAALTTTLVFVAARRHGGVRAGVVGAILCGLHLLVWEWATVVKTGAVVLPLLMGALVLATDPEPRAARWVLAGVGAGLAVATRLLALPLALAVFVAGARGRREGEARGRAAKIALGCFVGVLPALVCAGLAPDAFWFDTMRADARESAGLFDELPQKIAATRALLLPPLGATRPDVTGFQTVTLGVLAALGCRRRDADTLIYAIAGLGLLGSAFVPSPTAMHDFALGIAPLSVLAGRAVSRFEGRVYRVVLPVAYALGAVAPFRDRIIVQPDFARPAAFDTIGDVLDLVTHEGDRVAAHFPAYLVASARRPLPEARTSFGRLHGGGMATMERKSRHLYTEADLRAALVEGRARAFVVGSFTDPGTALAVREAGWQRRSDLPGATVWVLPETRP